TSKRARAPATEALRLSMWPDMGMCTSTSHDSRTRRWRPVPSLPTTMQTGSSASSRANRLASAVPSRPMHQTPEAPSCAMARAEVGAPGDGEVLEGAGGGLDGHGGQGGTAVAGKDEAVAAGGLGATGEGAEV